MMSRRGRGIHRIRRAGPMAAAARAISAVPAGTGYSTASLLSRAVFASLAIVAGPCRTGHDFFDLLRRMSPVVAPLRHHEVIRACPLSGKPDIEPTSHNDRV